MIGQCRAIMTVQKRCRRSSRYYPREDQMLPKERKDVEMIKNGSEVTYREQGDALVVCVGGEVDHHGAVTVRTGIDQMLVAKRPPMVYLELSAVSFMDSSGIGLVMGRYRNLSRRGAKLHITGTSPQIYKVMKLSGIEKLATIDECKK